LAYRFSTDLLENGRPITIVLGRLQSHSIRAVSDHAKSIFVLGCTVLVSGILLGCAVPSQAERSTEQSKVDWSVLLPAGEGRSEVATSCSGCHDLRQVMIQKKSTGNWSATVQKMVSAYQAPVDKDDIPPIIAYLAANFGSDNPIDQLPIDLNTCKAEALSRLPGISRDVAKAVIEARVANGHFKSVDDLLRVGGIDHAGLEKIKPYVKAVG